MNAYFTKTKSYPIITAILVFGVLFLVPQLLFAQAAADGEKGFIMAGLQGLLYSIVNVVFGTLAGLAGLLLNEAVTTYVVGFGNLYATSGLGYTIDNLWSTVRDIFNLTFIFGLVYIGFKMIFNSGDSSAKRMLGSLVLAALLVNFSLFITKFVIDFSNIAAAQVAAGFNSAGTYAVSDGFMSLMGISGLFSTGPSLADKTTSAGFAFIFGSLILYVVAAFVFAAGGMLLIIRFVVLNIYMILSPLMFLGMVFPGFSNVSRDYWSGFLSRAFFAPAYLLMLYFAHQILVNMRGVGAGTSQMAEVFGSPNPVANFSSTIPYFILTAVFMIASLVVAQKMGAQGATSALALGKRASAGARKYAKQGASKVVVGGSAYAGRQTVGRAANWGTNNPSLQAWAAKSGVVGSVGRGVMKTTQVAASGTYDARNLPLIGGVLAQGTKDKNKKGYASRRDAARKKRNEEAAAFGNTLGKVDINTPEGMSRLNAAKEKRILAAKAKPDSALNKQLQSQNALKAAEQAAAAKEAQISTLKNNLEAEITKLKEDVKFNPVLKDTLAKKQSELNDLETTSGLKDLKSQVDTARVSLESSQKLAEAEIAAISAEAESSVVYANQIKWAETMQKKADSLIHNLPGIKQLTGQRTKETASYLNSYYGANGENAGVSMKKAAAAEAAKDGESKLLKELQKKLKDGDEPEEKSKPEEASK